MGKETNGRAGRPDELAEFIEGAVEAGGVIDPSVLASELGCSPQHVCERLQEHPLTDPFYGRDNRLRFLSRLLPPAYSEEGKAALQEEHRRMTDRLGRDAAADFHSLVAERARMSSQRRRGRTRVIRRF